MMRAGDLRLDRETVRRKALEESERRQALHRYGDDIRSVSVPNQPETVPELSETDRRLVEQLARSR